MTNQDNDAFIAYFSVHSTNDNKGYMGGMMVHRPAGRPTRVSLHPTDKSHRRAESPLRRHPKTIPVQ